MLHWLHELLGANEAKMMMMMMTTAVKVKKLRLLQQLLKMRLSEYVGKASCRNTFTHEQAEYLKDKVAK